MVHTKKAWVKPEVREITLTENEMRVLFADAKKGSDESRKGRAA